MMSRVLFSAQSVHHATPTALYADLDREFQFTLDPCPLRSAHDGLALSWKGHRVFCNPPYGRGVGQWLAKSREPDVAVYLLPARTDTRWWHDYAMRADEIRFLRGRLRFGGHKGNAPFPSVVLVYSRPDLPPVTIFRNIPTP
jgi:site-specific DNA-methyltransferase (adenine-specific)